MIFRNVILLLTVCLLILLAAQGQTVFPDLSRFVSLTPVVFAQDLNQTILPITQLKWLASGIKGEFGTGFCLDPECRLIGTNYHVAVMARPRRIKGEKVIQVYFATGPDDEGASLNASSSVKPLRYTLNRDLAIFELNHSLPHYHGMPFSLNDLQTGQQVEIYAYPKESIGPTRKLLQFHGAFKGKTTTGLLAFDYAYSNGKAIRPGASGGLVVDSKTQQIVGVLNSVAKSGEAVALAVPVQSLADFVSKVQPWLAQRLFPSASEGNILPGLSDLYPKFEQPPVVDLLLRRPDEPAEIKLLREKAQRLADSMRDFVALQTLAWGTGENNVPVAAAAYEVQVLDGFQQFREYPNGKKEFHDVPFPPLNTVVVPGSEWSELPQMVGTALRLKIHQAANAVIDGRPTKVFQYRAEFEDSVCGFRSVFDFGLFKIKENTTASCYGEVWTDQETNILRISEHVELYGRWKDYQTVVTYGWLRRTDEVPRLIPLTFSTQAKYGKKLHWCRGQFVDYRVFSSRVKLLVN